MSVVIGCYWCLRHVWSTELAWKLFAHNATLRFNFTTFLSNIWWWNEFHNKKLWNFCCGSSRPVVESKPAGVDVALQTSHIWLEMLLLSLLLLFNSFFYFGFWAFSACWCFTNITNLPTSMPLLKLRFRYHTMRRQIRIVSRYKHKWQRILQRRRIFHVLQSGP